MKYISVLISMCLGLFMLPLYAVHKEDLLLVVVIMVKNEEAVIRPTLEMYCKTDPRAQQIGYFIFDTGSTDKTIEKAKELFRDYGITRYEIAQEPFIDFATSRNRGLRLAEEAFPHAHFLLMPDAEWYLNNVPALLEFCTQHINDYLFDAYHIQVLSVNLDFCTARLMHARRNLYFKGVVHECLMNDRQDIFLRTPSTIYFEYPEKPAGLEASRKRWLRDCELLLKEYTQNPTDPRTIFYLAQTYDCLEDYENAYYYYIKRSKLKGFDEEDYMTHFRMGYLLERQLIHHNKGSWATVLRHYLNAFMMRPTRAEPLVRIAAFYINNNIYDLAFLYAYCACMLPYPADVLFVEKDLYTKFRYEILAKAVLKVPVQLPQQFLREAIEKNRQEVPLEEVVLSRYFPYAKIAA